jgi:CRISPR-associated protein Csh2
MNKVVDNRSEILFLYDVTDANPNGDPMDENRPRIDEETGVNIVTDVRLKRTIRDYLRDYRGKKIFLQAEEVIEGDEVLLKAKGAKLEEEFREALKKELEREGISDEERKLIIESIDKIIDLALKKKEKPEREKSSGKEAKSRWVEILKNVEDSRKELLSKIIENTIKKVKTEEIKKYLFEKFIDLRLFGAALAVENISIWETGPVQFKFGRSLHKVKVDFYKGSTTMPVEAGEGFKKGKRQAEFTEEYRLPYSLICFYGVINENVAKNTGLTEDDVKLLLDGIWNGTKNLVTRSKIGQMPRFLLRIVYKKNGFHIGDLDKMVKLKKRGGDLSEEEQVKIRDISEVEIDISELIKAIKRHKDKIDRIEFKVDHRVQFTVNNETFTSEKLKEKFAKNGEIPEDAIAELQL